MGQDGRNTYTRDGMQNGTRQDAKRDTMGHSGTQYLAFRLKETHCRTTRWDPTGRDGKENGRQGHKMEHKGT